MEDYQKPPPLWLMALAVVAGLALPFIYQDQAVGIMSVLLNKAGC